MEDRSYPIPRELSIHDPYCGIFYITRVYRTGVKPLEFPALQLRITPVHLEELPGEHRRLVAPGATPDLQKCVF